MKRRFGTGDVLIIIGAALCLLFLVMLLGKYVAETGADFLAASLILLLAVNLFAAAALILSLTVNEKWLLVVYAWFALIFFMVFCKVSTLDFRALNVGKGTDFFILLGAAFMGVGAYMAQSGIGVFPEPRARAPRGGTPAEQLAQLKEMFEKGLITEDDYNKKREALVNKI